MTEQEEVGDRGFDWMELVNTVSTFILLNLLWLVCSLLVITLPAATAALFATIAPWGRGQSPSEPLANFFVAMKKYALKATAVSLINLLLGSLVTFNYLALRQIGTDQLLPIMTLIVTTIITFLLLLSNIYLWPLLVTVNPPLSALIKNSLKLALVHPFWGAGVLVGGLLPFLISLLLPQAFFITVTFAATVLIINAGAWRIIRRYLDEEDLQTLRGYGNL
ncbi:MAG: DUF624 domain-containing protein [Ardenticatenaceae bacterium]|nr:DUF624 domain-containing protein [Ardenticatenaceae bacterium]